ncbi:MAG: bifunctional folylpolyglutamate synthase/dihydrofolate synthase [Clostridiales bacterium]|nr:bifunctional folylpolyglutamate synthase/dihydrofolate synthase [Clostridiales bacterium]
MKINMQEAVSFLYDLPKFTTKNSLDHTRKFMRLLGDPCLNRKVIHVAGSNGKGSVCCFLYSMLLCAGKRAAMFTSPHLVDIRERFQVNGGMVSEEDFLLAFDRVKEASEKLVQNNDNHPTFFEFIFAMAMVLFEKAGAEYIILETGLGGRLDATNSYPHPILSVITSVSLEHTEILGDTLAQIAAEKAGILKPGVPVVFLDEDPEAAEVIRSRAERLGCPYCAVSCDSDADFRRTENSFPVQTHLSVSCEAGTEPYKSFYICEIKENGIDFSFVTAYDRANDEGGASAAQQPADCEQAFSRQTATPSDRCGIQPSPARVWNVPGYAHWQAQNAALAVTAMRLLRLMPDDLIQQGLSAAVWPGRMQEVQPGIWFDGAHNPSGIAAFAQTVQRLTAEDPYPPLLVFSMVREKDIRTAVRLLTDEISWAAIAVAAVPGERGVPPETLAELFREAIASRTDGLTKASASRTDALTKASAARTDSSAKTSATRTDSPVKAAAFPTPCSAEAFASPGAALSAMRARQKPGQQLFCTGSLYFVGALLKDIQ